MRDSNCTEREYVRQTAARDAYKRSAGFIDRCVARHEAECEECQRELTFLAEGGRGDLGETLSMADKIDRAMDYTPRCICGAMLAEVRGLPHCTVCGGG